MAQKIPHTSGHESTLIEHVDREPLAQEHDERVPGADLERVAGGQLDQLRIVSRAAHQPRARGLAEGDSEPQPRHSSDERLVQILDGLDEVRLPEDQVQILWIVDADDLQLELLGALIRVAVV